VAISFLKTTDDSSSIAIKSASIDFTDIAAAAASVQSAIQQYNEFLQSVTTNIKSVLVCVYCDYTHQLQFTAEDLVTSLLRQLVYQAAGNFGAQVR
jgi:hypothetical protein